MQCLKVQIHSSNEEKRLAEFNGLIVDLKTFEDLWIDKGFRSESDNGASIQIQ